MLDGKVGLAFLSLCPLKSSSSRPHRFRRLSAFQPTRSPPQHVLAMAATVYEADGDILVSCNSTSFRLSSKMLSVASPVFERMFHPGFKEGCSLSEKGFATVDLPEDPEVFKIFCDILYHKLDSLPQNPNSAILRNMSVFIDKYMCREAFLYYGKALLQQPLRGQTQDSLWRLLQFAFCLKLDNNFAKITCELILTRPIHSGDWGTLAQDIELLPEEILGVLDSRREQLARKTEDAFTQMISDVSRTVPHTCSSSQTFVGSYVVGLATRGIMPGTASFRDTSFVDIYNAAIQLPPYTFSGSGHHKRCGCEKLLVTDYAAVLVSRLAALDIEEEGVCLSCLNLVDCNRHPK
ncbi:hypothetical protein BDW75DRAFT_26757 [Aspergillus navahoensis]